MPGNLQSRTPEEYGDKYQDHLLEQYKLYVQTSVNPCTQHVSEKRQNSNNYLLTLNSTLVTLFVVFLSTFGHHRWNALVPATGLVICFLWYSLVDSYKDLNTAKFAVIHELENQLPVALFRHEWYVSVATTTEKDEDKPVVRRGDMPYVPLTHLERAGLPVDVCGRSPTARHIGRTHLLRSPSPPLYHAPRVDRTGSQRGQSDCRTLTTTDSAVRAATASSFGL